MVGVVALDGTKVKANASLSANRTQEHIRKMLAEKIDCLGRTLMEMKCLKNSKVEEIGWHG